MSGVFLIAFSSLVSRVSVDGDSACFFWFASFSALARLPGLLLRLRLRLVRRHALGLQLLGCCLLLLCC